MKKQVLFCMETTSSVNLISHETAPTEQTLMPGAPRTLTGQDQFVCENHDSLGSTECRVCKGLGHVSGNNNFVKFVEAVLECKLGLRKADMTESTDVARELCFSSILEGLPRVSQQRLFPMRKSMRCSYQPESKSCLHNGIQCNQCHQYPIRGKRYVCNICEDYDLCEGCYKKQLHQHKNFELVVQSKSEISKDRLRDYAIKQDFNACTRLSKLIQSINSWK